MYMYVEYTHTYLYMTFVQKLKRESGAPLSMRCIVRLCQDVCFRLCEESVLTDVMCMNGYI